MPANVTNWITNPSIETNANGWTGGSGVISLARSSDTAWTGSQSLKIIYTGPTAGGILFTTAALGLSAGTHVVNAAFQLSGPGGTVIPQHRLRLNYSDASTLDTNIGPTTLTGTWQPIAFPPVTSDPAKTINTIFLYVVNVPSTASAFTVYVDALDVRIDQSPDFYIDGDQGPGFTWTGTNHGSASVRDGNRGPAPGPGQNRTLVLFPAATRTTVGTYSQQLDVGRCGGLRFDLDLTAVTAPIGFNAEFWDPAKGAWGMVYSFTQQAAPGHYVSHLHPEMPLSANVSYPVIPEKKCRVTFTGSGTYTGSLSCSIEAP